MRGRESTTDGKPDPETGVAPGFTRYRNMRSRCRCSMCPAIHINSRSWLRSSSTHEPSDPPLRIVSHRRSSDSSFQLPGGRGSRRETLGPHPVFRENSKEGNKSRPGRPVLCESGRDSPYSCEDRLFKPLRRCFPGQRSRAHERLSHGNCGRARHPRTTESGDTRRVAPSRSRAPTPKLWPGSCRTSTRRREDGRRRALLPTDGSSNGTRDPEAEPSVLGDFSCEPYRLTKIISTAEKFR